MILYVMFTCFWTVSTFSLPLQIQGRIGSKTRIECFVTQFFGEKLGQKWRKCYFDPKFSKKTGSEMAKVSFLAQPSKNMLGQNHHFIITYPKGRADLYARSLSPAMPATIITMQITWGRFSTSLNRKIPRMVVPTMPKPVHMA